MNKDKVLDILTRDKLRLMGGFNRALGHRQPTRKEAEFFSFPFKIRQPDMPTFIRKYRSFNDKMIRLLQEEKVVAVEAIQIVPLEEPDYIKYRLDVTL